MACLLLLPLLCLGCGSGYKSTSAVAALIAFPPGVLGGLSHATISATLTGVTPAAVQAGTALPVVLVGSGVGAQSTVLMDGVTHAATVISSGVVEVSLTASDTASEGRHTFIVQNAGQSASDSAELLVTSGYQAFGDSITYGASLQSPATQSYPALLAGEAGLALRNNGVPGAGACDLWAQIYTARIGYTSVRAPLYSLMIGTNDVDLRGPGAYERVFSNCDLAALTWLGTPRENKVLPGDAAMSASGACSNTAASSGPVRLFCSPSSGAGNVIARLSTTGNPIYVWYLIGNTAATGEGLAVVVDGTPMGNFSTRADPSIGTFPGVDTSVGVARLPVAAGIHTVSISTTGTAGIYGIGSNSANSITAPRLLVGDLPQQLTTHPVSSVAWQLAYLADILMVEQQLLADGMDVHRAQTRDSMLGTAAEMNDQLHPNVLGQQHLASAFEAALP